jgi:streptogramin lyase
MTWKPFLERLEERTTPDGNHPVPSLTMNVFPVPLDAGFNLEDIVQGSDGNFWFSNTLPQAQINRMTPDGTVTSYPLPNADSLATGAHLNHLVLGPDGNVWFAIDYNQQILDANGFFAGNQIVWNLGYITPAGNVTLFPLSNNTQGADYLAVGPDGNIWFTEPYDNRIGRMTTSGQVTEFSGFTNLGNTSDYFNLDASQPDDDAYFRARLFSGPDGNIWFIEPAARKYGRIDTSGGITEFDMPTGSYQDLSEIFTGPDGGLWGVLGGLHGATLVQISSSSGQLTNVPGYVVEFAEPVRASDGTVWADGGNGIAKLTPDLQVTAYWGLPQAFKDGPNLLLAADGSLWLTTGSGPTCAIVHITQSTPPAPTYSDPITIQAQPWQPYSGVVLTVHDFGLHQIQDLNQEAGPNPSYYQGIVDWGDGSPLAPSQFRFNQVGVVQLLGSTTYQSVGTFTVTVTIVFAPAVQFTPDDGGFVGGPENVVLQATTTANSQSPNARYVLQLYQDLLNRPADAAGLTFWSAQLDQGTPRTVIAQQLSHSAEYYQTNVIKPAYQQYLNRPADQAGLDFWTRELQNGMTDEQMQAGFIASDEFYRNSGGSNALWVDALYEALLSRPADQPGEAFWSGELQGNLSRYRVANGFTGSQEGLGLRVLQTYQRYLGRSASQLEINYWVALYRLGRTNEDIITSFTSSDEFFKNATAVTN